jgi:hypothetical protein
VYHPWPGFDRESSSGTWLDVSEKTAQRGVALAIVRQSLGARCMQSRLLAITALGGDTGPADWQPKQWQM